MEVVETSGAIAENINGTYRIVSGGVQETARESFFRMNNPWIWLGFILIVIIVIIIYWAFFMDGQKVDLDDIREF